MKKILKSSLCFCALFMMGWCLTHTYLTKNFSNVLLLQNVEALSQYGDSSEDLKKEYKGRAEGNDCYITDPVTNKAVKGKRVVCYWTGKSGDFCFEGACGRCPQ